MPLSQKFLRFFSSSSSSSTATVLPRPSLNHRYVRDNIDLVTENIKARRSLGSATQVAELYDQLIQISKKADDARAARNAFSRQGRKNASSMKDRAVEGRRLKMLSNELTSKKSEIEAELLAAAKLIPNSTHPDVPTHEKVVDTFGAIPTFDAEPKNHLELSHLHDLADFESAGKVSGSKFVYFKNEAVLLELALTQWALQKAIDAGFTPISCPDLVRPSIVEACGFAPRGESSQIYNVQGGQQNLSLAATAEIPLAGMFAGRTFHRDELFSEGKKGQKVVGVNHCFRTEAGAAGEENKGFYRLHQFTKVELFAVTLPEHSNEMLEDIINLQKSMYRELDLPYQVIDMPPHELGSSAYRKYDIEAWMPSRLSDEGTRGTYGEISSASNCTDYQSRRLQIRYFNANQEKGKKTDFCHTLNGTACAIPRIILAILENNQQADGSVVIPKAIRSFLGGMEKISK
eukprot:g672.t1